MAVPALALLSLALSPNSTMDNRAKDWRMGAVVYQVFVDRFAPSANLAAKSAYYQTPRRLRKWDELPTAGTNNKEAGLWSHEMDFWGGDLPSIQSKLEYVQGLGADVLYLTPIHRAFSNHKYDASDFKQIDPAFGTKADLKNLTQDVHRRKMRIMLDGVFNHMGRHSDALQSALQDPQSAYRDWFTLGKNFRNGYKAWIGIANLPALNLENPKLREYLWTKPDSVVQQALKDGIDGWRLDVAYELGPTHLAELTHFAHQAKPGSGVVGEIWGYPAGWFPALDGVFNFFAPSICIEAMRGHLSGGRVGTMLNHMVDDAGIDNLLRSWLVLDNHDTERLTHQLPDRAQREFAMALQFTLPGSPVVYYGTELGMSGGGDPANRAPMRWDLVNDSNPTLKLSRKLISSRKAHPALRYGDFNALDTEKLIAFTRTTGKLREIVLVVANPTDHPVRELLTTRLGKLMSWQSMKDLLTGEQVQNRLGFITAEVPAHTVRIFVPVVDRNDGHSQYDRID